MRLAAVCSMVLVLCPAQVAWAAEDAAAANQADAACIAITAAGLALNKDEALRPGLMSSIAYYIGRIRGRSPAYDLEAGIRAQLSRLQNGAAVAEATRCSEELKTMGEEMTAIGRSLQANPTAAPGI